MKSLNVEVSEEREFAAIVADEIVASIQDAISERGECSIALSGGSTPSSIYRLLGRPPRDTEIQWDKLHIFWGDERFVPHDHSHSNYRMTQETLLHNIKIPAENVHMVNTDLESVEESAVDYGSEIEKYVKQRAANGSPAFDIVLLGIGEDGHTASLFPNGTELKVESVCAASVEPASKLSRVSLSLKTISSARKLIFIAKGEDKADVVQRCLETEVDITDMPARVFTIADSNVVWFLDSAAAVNLERSAA